MPEVTQDSIDLLALADEALAEDADHIVATGDELAWLIAQLASWPLRVNPDYTTNDRFLRMSAAATLKALSSRHPSEDVVEAAAKEIFETIWVDKWTGGLAIEADLYRQAARAALSALSATDGD